MENEALLTVINTLAEKISLLEYQLHNRDKEIEKLEESNDAFKEAIKELEQVNYNLQHKGE